MKASGWIKLALSFICGAALVLAFAPFNLWVFAPLCMAAFFGLLSNASPKQAWFSGFIFGMGLYTVGVSWVYVSLSTYGGMPFWMGSIAVLGFAALLSSLIGAMAWTLARSTPPNSSLRLLLLPFAWCVFEWLKSWVLTGFPWLDLGYSQVNTWFAGWAPIGGIYLIGFLLCVVASVLTHSVVRRSLKLVPVLMAIIAVSWGVNKLEWTELDGAAMRVAIVQANVPINQKWQADNRQRVLQNYQSQSQLASSNNDLDLIVWPETALPVHLQYLSQDFWPSVVPEGAALLTGLVDTPSLLDAEPSYERSYNAAALICAGESTRPQIYRKRHLVPFGEYLPLRFLFQWVLDYLELPMSDFNSGTGMQPLNCGSKIRVGLSICYEDAFAGEYRRYLGDANMLINIGEDAWFGDSFAPHQRLQMAQMRARELSRPMVRSANSGPSAFIDHRGNIVSQGAQFKAATLVASIQPQRGDTWFRSFGNWIVLLSALVWVLACVRPASSDAKQQKEI